MKKTRKRRNTKSFIEDCVIKHNSKYNYDKTIYKTMHDSIIITCREHGDFTQVAKRHLEGHGCRKCSTEKQKLHQKDTTIGFISKAKAIHGNLYDYSKSVYGKNAHDKLIVICLEHGDFLVSPNQHISRQSKCPKCSKKSQGWTKTSWRKACENKVPKLYVIKCYNDKETFYKIGITSKKDIKKRFSSKHWMPYEWSIEKVIESDEPDYIFNLEKEMHKLNQKHKYEPKIFFDGFSECFSNYADCH